MIGETIGHYEILEKLGEGGMGIVYKARDTKLDRLVALKFLPTRLNATAEDRARFLQEARAAASLNHPNVCGVIDIREEDERGGAQRQSFIVMEYVEGRTVRALAQELSVRQAVDIGLQVAEGLAAAHEKGIIHRDIKSDNIMVRPDGRAQIMDFGLAKLQGVSSLTKAGSTVGTTSYMSPEQVQGMPTDYRTDIFALGVVLYEMLAHELPFRGGHEAAVMYEIVNVEPPRLALSRPDMNNELERVVRKCLEKDPADRYQSARDVAVDLRRYRRDSDRGTGSSPSASRRAPAPPPAQRPGWLTWAGAAAVVLVLAVGGWLAFGSRSDAIDSLAVLPFEQSGAGQAEEYLCDGITENLINNLSQIPQLRVVPRSTVFRYKGRDFDPQTVGRELGVRAVLTGRLGQKGNDLTVQVDLIDVAEESQLWGQQYHRTVDDIQALQSDVTREVSEKLRLAVTGETEKQLTRRVTEDPEAYQLYLLGRFHQGKRKADDLTKAVEYFSQAIARDPSFALAYASLADTYLLEGQYSGVRASDAVPRAERAAERALALDPSLAEVHATLGMLYHYSWRWEDAEREFLRAIAMKPNYATSYHWYAILLWALNRNAEALTRGLKAQQLDPTSLAINLTVGVGYFQLGDMEKARAAYRRVRELDSTFQGGPLWDGYLLLSEGMPEEALPLFRTAARLSKESPETICGLAKCLSVLGKNGEAQHVIDELVARYRDGTSDAYNVAEAYSGTSDREATMKWLATAIEDRSSWVYHLRLPIWKEYRSDPQFRALVAKTGMPQ
jgi:TolB-like protein/Tfp pilus assembly protein PilF/tRNA A-37 threonylcarbamoyl transferase component Bud32